VLHRGGEGEADEAGGAHFAGASARFVPFRRLPAVEERP